MPTNEQMQAIIDQIKRFESSSFELEGAFYRESPGGSLSWNDLPETERLVFLDGNVNWEGFSRDQEFDVISRVADGEAAEFWMDDIRTDMVIAEQELINGYQEMVDDRELEQAVTEVEKGWALDVVMDQVRAGQEFRDSVEPAIQESYELQLSEAVERAKYRAANDNERTR